VIKYPRTPHLEGSRLQPGDHDLAQIELDHLRGRYVVVEEKLDGANAGIAAAGLQSRGHLLTGGPREKHFDLFKRWAATHAPALRALTDGGLVVYGEWLYAKHTIFYDALPHYFLEFDVRSPDGTFWSTARRRAHLAGSPVVSVPVLWEGVVEDPAALIRLVAPSLYKTPRWRDAITDWRETDPSDHAEGLYVKVEEDGRVVERYKWIRASFLTSVLDSGSHWLDRPIVPNRLADGVDLFAVAP
jgi:hypothetical protein